jgi:hypothetical protein
MSVTQDGYVWVEGHYRRGPDKKSYPRSNLPTTDDEKARLHKLRNIKVRMKKLQDLKEQLEEQL